MRPENRDPKLALASSLKNIGLSPADIGLQDVPDLDPPPSRKKRVQKQQPEEIEPQDESFADEPTDDFADELTGLYDEGDDPIPDDEEEPQDEVKSSRISGPSKKGRKATTPPSGSPIQSIDHVRFMCIYVHVIGEDPYVQVWTPEGKHLFNIRDSDVISSIYD